MLGQQVLVRGDHVHAGAQRALDEVVGRSDSADRLDEDVGPLEIGVAHRVREEDSRRREPSARRVAHDAGDELELAGPSPQQLEDAAADLAEPGEHDAQAPARSHLGERAGTLTDGGRLAAVHAAELERDAVLAREPDGFVLDDRAVRPQGVGPGRPTEAPRWRSGPARVVLVEPVDVFHEPAPSRSQRMGDDQRREVGAPAAEGHGASHLVARHEAGEDHDLVSGERRSRRTRVEGHRRGVERVAPALQIAHRRQDTGRHAGPIEQASESGGGLCSPVASNAATACPGGWPLRRRLSASRRSVRAPRADTTATTGCPSRRQR